MLTRSWLSDKPEIASTDLRNLLLVGNRQWNFTITRTYLNHGRQVAKGTCSFVEQNAVGDVIQSINETEEIENMLNPYLVPPTTRTNKIHLQEDKSWRFRYMEMWPTGPGQARVFQVEHVLVVDADCLCDYIASRSGPRPIVAIAPPSNSGNFHRYWHCPRGGREDWSFYARFWDPYAQEYCIVEDHLER